MAVALLIGGDAGISGDVRVTEPGKTTSQRDGGAERDV